MLSESGHDQNPRGSLDNLHSCCSQKKLSGFLPSPPPLLSLPLPSLLLLFPPLLSVLLLVFGSKLEQWLPEVQLGT
jgi:hypothetical protein